MHCAAAVLHEECAQFRIGRPKRDPLKLAAAIRTQIGLDMVGADQPCVDKAMARQDENGCGMSGTIRPRPLQRIEQILGRSLR